MSQLQLTKLSTPKAQTADSSPYMSRTFSNRLFHFFQPALRRLNDDRAYRFTRWGLRAYPHFLIPKQTDFPLLATQALGLTFSSPLGIGAGFDKDGACAHTLLRFGASFVEIGTATPRAQQGNAGTTIKVLEAEQACVNGMGFPSGGIDKLITRLAKKKQGLLGVNIGANRNSTDKIADYVSCVEKLNEAKTKPDYITINISSPNTPGLRQLEELDQLALLLDSIKTEIPLLLKLSPDMADEAYADIAALALEKNLAGLVATNTTIHHQHKNYVYGGGGLSGAPLRARAETITRLLYQKLGNKLPIIGVGGISSGEDAYRRIRAGATLLQLWTALIWHGPDLIGRINAELAFYLQRDGFSSIAEAVGTDNNNP